MEYWARWNESFFTTTLQYSSTPTLRLDILPGVQCISESRMCIVARLLVMFFQRSHQRCECPVDRRGNSHAIGLPHHKTI